MKGLRISAERIRLSPRPSVTPIPPARYIESAMLYGHAHLLSIYEDMGDRGGGYTPRMRQDMALALDTLRVLHKHRRLAALVAEAVMWERAYES